MPRIARLAALLLSAFMLSILLPAASDAQGRGRRPPPRPVVRGQVFIGGYFYDPRFGPYPWWQPRAYPHWYFPVYDRRAELRVLVTPEEAAVYVDGFYAGVADDFDGALQALPLPPGGHNIVLYLDGYRTAHHNVYLARGSTFKLRYVMAPLPAGETSEPPALAPAVPSPPPGSFKTPRSAPPIAVPAAPEASEMTKAAGVGTLDLHVQPATAELTIDGRRWLSSDGGHFLVQLPEGRHRIEVAQHGYRPFSADIDLGDAETTLLNVTLLPVTR